MLQNLRIWDNVTTATPHQKYCCLGFWKVDYFNKIRRKSKQSHESLQKIVQTNTLKMDTVVVGV